jgi:hypothetical protein
MTQQEKTLRVLSAFAVQMSPQMCKCKERPPSCQGNEENEEQAKNHWTGSTGRTGCCRFRETIGYVEFHPEIQHANKKPINLSVLSAFAVQNNPCHPRNPCQKDKCGIVATSPNKRNPFAPAP